MAMTTYVGALVSAIITTHNRADLLPRAIDSVLKQTYDNLEIIVVDDGSLDCTEKVIREYQKKYDHIRYLRLDRSQGACAARNYGIREARGEFVAGLDDDDEWLPRRVEVLLKNYRDDYSFVCARDIIVYKDRKVYRKWRRKIKYNDMLYGMMASNQLITKRGRVLTIGGFDTNLTAGQDYDLCLRLMKLYGSAIMVPEYLQIIYRDHSKTRISVTKNKFKGSLDVYKKYKPEMKTSQRVVRLVEFKKRRNKKIEFIYFVRCFGKRHFFSTFKYYMRGLAMTAFSQISDFFRIFKRTKKDF